MGSEMCIRDSSTLILCSLVFTWISFDSFEIANHSVDSLYLLVGSQQAMGKSHDRDDQVDVAAEFFQGVLSLKLSDDRLQMIHDWMCSSSLRSCIWLRRSMKGVAMSMAWLASEMIAEVVTGAVCDAIGSGRSPSADVAVVAFVVVLRVVIDVVATVVVVVVAIAVVVGLIELWGELWSG